MTKPRIVEAEIKSFTFLDLVDGLRNQSKIEVGGNGRSLRIDLFQKLHWNDPNGNYMIKGGIHYISNVVECTIYLQGNIFQESCTGKIIIDRSVAV